MAPHPGVFYDESRNPKRVIFFRGLDAVTAGKTADPSTHGRLSGFQILALIRL